uniref:Uncharacterized protein n=1 Tax=Anopheles arabiensis TaxID=7173 RepID=A0A182IFF5_ANOAR
MRQPPWAPDTSLPFHHTIFEPALTCFSVCVSVCECG